MGWWKKGDDLVGDGPVDTLERSLATLSEDETKPTWQAFLDAAAAALERDAESILADPESIRGKRLRARFEPPAPDVVSGGAAKDEALTDKLSSTFIQIADEYQTFQERLPRLTEILKTIVFSLAVGAESFLSVDEEVKLSDIAVEPR